MCADVPGCEVRLWVVAACLENCFAAGFLNGVNIVIFEMLLGLLGLLLRMHPHL